jgi:hypothetical protein
LFIPVFEFLSDDSVVQDHRFFALSCIEEMDDNPTTIDMFEKLKSKTFSFTGSFDETRNILDNE